MPRDTPGGSGSRGSGSPQGEPPRGEPRSAPRRRKRRRPPNRLARHTAPKHIFVAGALTIIAFLFQENLVVRVAQVLAFALLATLAGKRIRWIYFVVMVSSITFFNLLTPVGRVLLEIGPFVLTAGALRQGLMKGFAIVGLVFISLMAVRPDLKLPGAFGGLLARLFYYFERVLDTRRHVSAAHLVESVDEILVELYPPGGGERAGEGGPTEENTTAADRSGAADRDEASEHAARETPPEPTESKTDALGAAGMIALVAVNAALAIVY